MIIEQFDTPGPIPFPLDQTTIATSVRIKDVVGNCLPDQLHTLPSDIRPLIRSISANAKPDRNWYPAEQRHQRYNPKIPTRTISVDGFGVIKLHATKDPALGWLIQTIDLNPGGIVNGNNGRILTEDACLRAFSIAIEVVTPLLANPADFIHIIPGLHPLGWSWWKSIEIPFHVLDDDGSILKAFAHAKHPEIHLAPYNARHGQSITFANSAKTLLIRVYRKDLQMVRKHGTAVMDPAPVLRIEVWLQGDKLDEHLRGGRRQVIDGQSRLVSFQSSCLRQAYLDVVKRLGGVYTRVPAPGGEHDNKLGRHMGWVAHETGLSVADQFDHYRRRFPFDTQSAESNTKSRLLKAARQELALLSPVALTELFSESAWDWQPDINVPKLEKMTRARHEGVAMNPLVAAAYGNLTPSAA